MHKLTDKQYEEYQRLCYARDHGRLLTPDGLRLVCAGLDYNPEAIGRHLLETLYAIDFMSLYGRTFGITDSDLNGDNEYKFSEFASHRELIRAALKELVLDVGFFPNGDKIKQIHVAGGALRVIYGKTLNTKKIKSLAFVAGKKHKDAPVPNVFPIDQLIKDTECFDEKPDDDDLLSMRKMLQKLLNTDGGMFPDDSQLTYSAGSKYFIKGHSQLEDAGEFIGKVINKYCPELAQYIRDVLSNADDPISVLFCPVEDEEETVISAGQGLNDLKAFVNQNAAMKWYLSSIKESGECLKGNLEKMPNTLTQLRTFIFFCTFQLVRYFSLLEAFNCDGKILPFLLDFSDNPASGIATASTASYARVYQSVSRFYSWAFAQELKDYPKSLFEELGGKYERQGDYLIPCLTVPAEEEQAIGIWGQRHLDYLKQYRKVTYTNLLTSGRLNAYLADINRQAQERFERLIEGMKQAQGITEQLKAENALEWTGCLNNIRACAREIVEKEIIFA